MKGKIIVIEGTECTGKETQSKLLAEKLNAMGIKAINLSFPMYDSPTGKIIGGSCLGKEEIGPCLFPEGLVNVDPKIACLYFAADRKYNITTINNYLDLGYYVILDRYISSNMAYQGSKILDQDERFNMYQWIDKLEYWLLGLPKPDLTILLKLPVEYKGILKNERDSLYNENINNEYLKNSEKAYIELSELYNWKTIECVDYDKIKAIDAINNEIISLII